MKTAQYNNFAEVVKLLDLHKVEYVVMRNYSGLMTEDLFTSGHADIDILCECSSKFAEAINATQCRPGDYTHYFIYINNKKVSLDLRHVGDGYYDTRWQKDILRCKTKHQEGFYIMDKVNLFYTLAYHATIQKKSISADYLTTFRQLSADLNIDLPSNDSATDLAMILEKFMVSNGYQYTYTQDKTVILNRKNIITKSLIKKDIRLKARHWKFDTFVRIIEILVSIKHFLRI
ncbi:MAG: hypothetical protein UH853_02575 [Muribaculaceae bacterium]|nr:hypothetical protein [Muribaculaceae bacterium]